MMALTGSEGIEVVNPYQHDAAISPDIDQRYFGVHNNLPTKHIHVERHKRLPFGWSTWALLILAAIISAVVVGAGVGGGLGAKLANCNKYVFSMVINKLNVCSHS